MKHFYSLLKRQGLFIDLTNDNTSDNTYAVHMVNHELIELGYVLAPDTFKALVKKGIDYITNLRDELLTNLNTIIPKDGGVIIYRNFPHDVPTSNYNTLYSALSLYSGSSNSDDIGTHIPSGFAFEPNKLKHLSLLTEAELNSIFTDLIYSSKSISANDKVIVDYFIKNGFEFDLSKITFNETKSYIGKRLLEDTSIEVLPIKSATTVLRIYASYSGGDEGLKEETVFKKPSKRLANVLLKTLDACYDLEESFKLYREKWLRVLFYINPMTAKNKVKYPTLYKFSDAIRNNPKTLKTFNSYVEEGLLKKDEKVFELLKKRSGVFGRRLDQTVRIFGAKAVDHFLATKVKFTSLVDNYNHFTNRDTATDRSVILANSGSSKLTTFGALEALPKKTVSEIKDKLFNKMNEMKHPLLADKKVYIDRALYYRPMVDNNRASSLSLGQANGTIEKLPDFTQTLRMYVQWYSGSDIDLSGFIIFDDNSVIKVGWDSYQNVDYVVYSGDNTGKSSVNDEYIDINLDKVPANAEWIVTDARVYSGNNYNKFIGGSPRAGWSALADGQVNHVMQKDKLTNSMLLSADAKNAFLTAYNVKEKAVVYLDIASSGGSISGGEDALKIRTYLNKIAVFDDGKNEVDWSRINQGHIINLLATNIVDTPEEADIVFDESTTFEEVAKYI